MASAAPPAVPHGSVPHAASPRSAARAVSPAPSSEMQGFSSLGSAARSFQESVELGMQPLRNDLRQLIETMAGKVEAVDQKVNRTEASLMARIEALELRLEQKVLEMQAEQIYGGSVYGGPSQTPPASHPSPAASPAAATRRARAQDADSAAGRQALGSARVAPKATPWGVAKARPLQETKKAPRPPATLGGR